MALNEELFAKYAMTTRKSVRRVHELEYVMQKFQKVASMADDFERQILKTQSAMKA